VRRSSSDSPGYHLLTHHIAAPISTASSHRHKRPSSQAAANAFSPTTAPAGAIPRHVSFARLGGAAAPYCPANVCAAPHSAAALCIRRPSPSTDLTVFHRSRNGSGLVSGFSKAVSTNDQSGRIASRKRSFLAGIDLPPDTNQASLGIGRLGRDKIVAPPNAFRPLPGLQRVAQYRADLRFTVGVSPGSPPGRV